MSGHNKWKQIKHKKAKADGNRSKIFSKYSRLITQIAREVKGQMTNPRLVAAITKAREYNMPNDNIDRAVKKWQDQGGELEAIAYEAYGPGGAALIIETLSPNRNKTAQEVKHALTDKGFALAGIGAATWAFNKETAGENVGEWTAHTTTPLSPEDTIALESLIEALEELDDVQDVYTNAE